MSWLWHLFRCSAFLSRSRLMLLCALWMWWLGELNVMLPGASSSPGCVLPIHQALMFYVSPIHCDSPFCLTSITALLPLPVFQFVFTLPSLTSPYHLSYKWPLEEISLLICIFQFSWPLCPGVSTRGEDGSEYDVDNPQKPSLKHIKCYREVCFGDSRSITWEIMLNENREKGSLFPSMSFLINEDVSVPSHHWRAVCRRKQTAVVTCYANTRGAWRESRGKGLCFIVEFPMFKALCFTWI